MSRPLPSTPRPQLNAPTATPTATRIQPTVALRRDLLEQEFQPQISQPSSFSISGASAYEYNVGAGQLFNFGNIQLQGGVRLFLQNPVDPSSFLRTDQKGVLSYRPVSGGQEREMSYSPFHAGFAGGISSIAQNKNRIVELDWSADGTRFSFRIDPPPNTDTANAGVWFWQPATALETDPTYAILRDCPAQSYASCNLVHSSNARFWQTKSVQWSPMPGDNSVLLTLRLPQESRNAIVIAEARRDPDYAKQAPQFVRYDYASWNADGRGITVSGRSPSGRVIIGAVNRSLQGEHVILDGSARGLWLRDAVKLPDGGYLALGRHGAPGSGPLALIDGAGNQISEYIGDAPPEAVSWFADRSAVVVAVQERQFTAYVDSGIVADYTGMAADPQFSDQPLPPASIPTGVISNSEYRPGQQLRIAVPYLNLRSEPSTASGIVAGLTAGDYVAVFAGPHENDGYTWWRVQTASNAFGWLAGAINGARTLRDP